MSDRRLICASALFYLLALGGLLPARALAQASLLPKYEDAAKGEPRDFEAQWSLAQAHLHAGQTKQAERVLQRAQAVAPSDSIGTLRLAEAWISEGGYKRARNACRALLRKHRGRDPVARLCLAKAYLAWNRSSRAFDELAIVAKEAPDLTEAQLVLAEAHRLRGQVKRAEAAYARARVDPALSAEADLGLGRLYWAAGRREQAVTALRRAAQKALPDAQYELAQLLGPTEEAETLLEAAVENRPGWADAASALGDVRLSRGDTQGAVQAYQAALAENEESYTAHRGMGRAQLRLGELDAAHASLTRALALFGNDPEAMLGLGEVLARQGRVDDALSTWRRAADLDLRNPKGLVLAAQLCIEQHRYTLAVGYLDRLLGAHPDSAAGLAAYGDVMRARGRRDLARDYYQRALQGEGELERTRVEATLAAM